MAVIDRDGRLFGRVNVVDAFAGLVVLALIPLAYGAYALFRTPPPRLTSVEPVTLQHGPNLRVTIRGEDLRPYMRVSIGDLQAPNFLFYNTTTAEIDLPDKISPGLFDVVLYDYAQERSRLVKALTIVPPPLPSTQLEVVGAFRNMTTDSVKSFSPGMSLGSVATVRRVGTPIPSLLRASAGDGTVEIPLQALDIPMVLRVGCYLKNSASRVECVGGEVALVPDAFLMMPTPLGVLPFQIDQVRSPVDIVDVQARVRFIGDAQTLGMLKPADIDVGVRRNPLASGAQVVGADAVRATAAVTILSEAQVMGANAIREATLRVPAQQGVGGWRYAGHDLRAGAPLKFRTMSYELTGMVLTVGAPSATTAATPE